MVRDGAFSEVGGPKICDARIDSSFNSRIKGTRINGVSPNCPK